MTLISTTVKSNATSSCPCGAVLPLDEGIHDVICPKCGATWRISFVFWTNVELIDKGNAEW